MKSFILPFTICGTLTFTAQAAPNDGIVGAYARVEVGQSSLGLSNTLPALESNESGQAIKLFGGYRFNENLGVEAGYTALGAFSKSVIVDGASVKQDGKARSLFDVATGRLPASKSFALHGRLGLSFDKVSGTDLLPASDMLTGSKTSTLLGLGLEYRPKPNIALAFNYDHYGKLSNNVKASALVLGFHFNL